MADNYQIDIPTPTPRPELPTPSYGLDVDMSDLGTQWAYESIQMWNTIPMDFRTGMQMAIVFGIFLVALIAFIRKLRKGDEENA